MKIGRRETSIFGGASICFDRLSESIFGPNRPQIHFLRTAVYT